MGRDVATDAEYRSVWQLAAAALQYSAVLHPCGRCTTLTAGQKVGQHTTMPSAIDFNWDL